MIEYSIVRSNRKTLAIHITANAQVQVRAPLRLPKSKIDSLVQSKEDWIEEHLALKSAQLVERTSFALTYGSTLLYRGKEYPIVSGEGRAVFTGTSFCVPANLEPHRIKEAVIALYKALAKSYLKERTDSFATIIKVSPTAVKITSAKTRWGSCSGKNSLNFSWMLMMAEDCVIDYVVVHELAHIREHNHSPRFWAVVAEVLPDYKLQQKGLLTLQNRLSGEDWG